MANQNSTESPWIICDSATRVAMEALQILNNNRKARCLTIEELAQRSGLHPMTVTRAMHGHGCNLAEFFALALALPAPAADVIRKACNAAPQRTATTAL